MLTKALLIMLLSSGAGWLVWLAALAPAVSNVHDDRDEKHSTTSQETTAANPAEKSRPAQEAKDNEHHDAKTFHVEVDEEIQGRLGMTFAQAKESSVQPQIRALGVVENNPAGSFTVRSPVAGYLRATAAGYPALGDEIAGQSVVAAIQPRLTPTELFALAAQVVDARSATAEAESELAAAQSSYESKRILNSAGKMVSDRQFEEAEARLKSVSARLDGARKKLELLTQQQSAVDRGLDPLPILTGKGGQVVEILAEPGEGVEAGQPLLKLALFDHLLARIDLPLGQSWPESKLDANIVPVGDDSQVFAARRVGRPTQAGARTRGESWLLEFDARATTLRAGAPIIAMLPAPGEPIKGVTIPASAVLRYGGLNWVFVRTKGNEFERRMVELKTRTRDGFFVTEGLTDDEVVVATGAQVLLSEQLKAQIEAEAEATE